MHMKELGRADGVYRHLKVDPADEVAFLSDCIQAIQIGTEFTTSATIRLADLAAFNADTGLQLSPRALALYGCIVEVRRKYPTQDVHLTLDRIVKPSLVIDAALEYARTDTYSDLRIDGVQINALGDGLTFRNTAPIQAADFTAWEIRRNCEERKTWNPTEAERSSPENLRISFEVWRQRFKEEFGRFPRDRASARMLSAWPPPTGSLWDYGLISAAHTNRHANGWAV